MTTQTRSREQQDEPLNIERLGQGERIAAGSALALLICMFLSWFNFSYTASNAWESLHYISPILAISIVATLGVAFSEAREMSIGDIPGGLTIFVLGCLSALLILFRLIDPISTPGIEGGSPAAVSRPVRSWVSSLRWGSLRVDTSPPTGRLSTG